MSRLVAIVCAVLLTATAALAAAKWNGAGWYRTFEAEDGGELQAGPFASESDCAATLASQPREEGFEYFCRYFSTEPVEYD